MANPQIRQIEQKIERLQVQLEYLKKIEELKEKQTSQEVTQNSNEG